MDKVSYERWDRMRLQMQNELDRFYKRLACVELGGHIWKEDRFIGRRWYRCDICHFSIQIVSAPITDHTTGPRMTVSQLTEFVKELEKKGDKDGTN